MRSYYEAIEECPENVQLELYRAISLYGLNRIEPQDMSALSKTLWILIKPLLDKQWTKFDNGKKGGASSGTMKGNQNARKKAENKPNSNRKQTENKATLSMRKDKGEGIKDKGEIENISSNAAGAAPHSSNIEARKKKFYNSLVPYVQQYGKEMIREFFDYWSECNKSQTKMRFEQQTTWETPKRLANWAKRQADYQGGAKQLRNDEEAEKRREWYRQDQERQAREQEERERSKAEAVSYDDFLKMKQEGKI
jgi:hypothetical protein